MLLSFSLLFTKKRIPRLLERTIVLYDLYTFYTQCRIKCHIQTGQSSKKAKKREKNEKIA